METATPLFTVTKWNAVAVWSWASGIENCAICRHLLSDLCIQCQGLEEGERGACGQVWGGCNHPFHEHCIDRWVEKTRNCPLCSRPWEVKPPQL